MTLPFWTVLAASILPIVCAWVSGYYRQKQLGSVDNKNPREQSLALTGPGQRAVAAQGNAWEALGYFAPAVIIAHLAGVSVEAATTSCLIFIVARVLHLVFYMADQDKLRSLAFIVGLGAAISLYVQAA